MKISAITPVVLCTALAAMPVAAQLSPNPVVPSDKTFVVEHVGTAPAGASPSNYASPVVAGGKLLIPDQNGALHSFVDGAFETILTADDVPAGITLDNRQSILGVAYGGGNRLYVIHQSGTLPEGINNYALPAPLPGICCVTIVPVPDLYRLDPMPNALFLSLFGPKTRTEYQVLVEYKLSGSKVKDGRAIVSFETQSGPTHNGGGMLVLPDGRVLFSTGDALPFGAEGRAAAQDPASHLSALLAIDPDSGAVEIVGKGFRNVQMMTFIDEDTIGLGDIGGITAEEVNVIELADVLDGDGVNLGWGRNADGYAREGTFYVGPGVPGIFGTQPPTEGIAPVPEPGFVQPHAQYGRFDPSAFIAVTGPVASETSFSSITLMFGDLASGEVLFTDASLDSVDATVYSAVLEDGNGNVLTLNQLAGGVRADPRFFNFPNGDAGVLLETTGAFFRITEQ